MPRHDGEALGNESGPVSGALHDESFNDQNLMLGVPAAMRDVSCNVVAPLGL